MSFIKYNNVIQTYTTPQYLSSECAEMSFINNGASNLIINNTLVLLPSQSIAFDGKQNEIDTTNYNISFTGAGVNSCVVVRKYYD